MDKKKRGGGACCAVKNCRNRCRNIHYSARNLKFFRFPKDINRARKWAIASNREDLLDRVDTLNSGYRLCSGHFETKMYMNHLCERLNCNAVPTLFPYLEDSSESDHNYSRPFMVKKSEDTRFKENENPVPQRTLGSASTNKEGPASERMKTIQDLVLADVKTVPECGAISGTIDVLERLPDFQPNLLSSSCSTQTTFELSNHTLRKKKLRHRFKSLAHEYKQLKAKIKDLQNKLNNIEKQLLLTNVRN